MKIISLGAGVQYCDMDNQDTLILVVLYAPYL